MPNRAVAAGLALAFLAVFFLTPPGHLVLTWLGFVPEEAWGWVLGFAALGGFVVAGSQAFQR